MRQYTHVVFRFTSNDSFEDSQYQQGSIVVVHNRPSRVQYINTDLNRKYWKCFKMEKL